MPELKMTVSVDPNSHALEIAISALQKIVAHETRYSFDPHVKTFQHEIAASALAECQAFIGECKVDEDLLTRYKTTLESIAKSGAKGANANRYHLIHAAQKALGWV